MTDSYKPIYLFYSEQAFRLKEAANRLKKKLSHDQSLDYYEFDWQTNAEEVVNAAMTMSLNLSKKIVVYKNIEKLDKKSWDILLNYAKKPNPLSVIVLSAELKNLKHKFAKSNLFVLASKNKFLYPLKVPKGVGVVGWIMDRAKHYECKIDRVAAQYLFEVAGEDLRILDNEIKKLSIFCNGKEATIETVKKSAINARESNIFDLVDAIGRKEAANALVTLNKILLDGEAPLKIFHMINRQFRLILEAKLLTEKGASLNQAASSLKLPSFAVSKYLDQGRNFTDGALKKIFQLMVETDYRLKTGGSQSLLLERMIAECVTI